jgi:pimeloyl-ACP methyl ester carboxylesterase
MPKIRVNGVDLHYWQSGQGEDVVLVHGLGGNLAGWHLTMVPELQRDYRVTTYDLRGHGRSDAPAHGYDTGTMAEDLRGLLDGLGIRQARLAGHSWGGDIVLHFALNHPRRASDLVLIEAGLLAPLADLYRSETWTGWTYVTQTLEQLRGAPIPADKRYDFEYLVRLLIEIPIQYGPAAGRVRDEDLLGRVVEVLRPMMGGEAGDAGLSLEALARIPHPALTLYEANSVCLDAGEELRRRLPRVSAAMLPGGKLKHFTGLEHPELILQHMKAFWNTERAPAVVESP